MPAATRRTQPRRRRAAPDGYRATGARRSPGPGREAWRLPRQRAARRRRRGPARTSPFTVSSAGGDRDRRRHRRRPAAVVRDGERDRVAPAAAKAWVGARPAAASAVSSTSLAPLPGSPKSQCQRTIEPSGSVEPSRCDRAAGRRGGRDHREGGGRRDVGDVGDRVRRGRRATVAADVEDAVAVRAVRPQGRAVDREVGAREARPVVDERGGAHSDVVGARTAAERAGNHGPRDACPLAPVDSQPVLDAERNGERRPGSA